MGSKGKVVVSVIAGAENQKLTKPEATVFVTVDTSGSMAGSKIQEVCFGLTEIIAQCPDYVRFTIRKFDETVKTVVSKKKKYLDIERLLSSLKSCGSRTALYDGIGQTIKEIPYNCSRLDVIHVLVFTDGCDNASTNYDLNSVINLLKEKIMTGNIHFTFIQAGRESTVIDALGSSNLPRSKYNVLKVEDTVAGIKMGFAEAQKKIKMRFEVRVLSNPSKLPDIGAIKICGLDGGAVSVQVGSPHIYPSGSPKSHPHQKYHYKGSGQQNPNFPYKQPLKYENNPNTNQNQPEKFPAGGSLNASQVTNHRKLPSATVLTEYSIWIGNIPKSSSVNDVWEFFRQWGNCKLESLTNMNECQCAVITYESKEGSERAIKYGHQTIFLGSKLKVFKS